MTTEEDKPAESADAKPAEKPAPKAEAAKPKKSEAKAARERTRTIVVMVLATAGLAVLLTLVSEVVFRPKVQPAPATSRSSETTAANPPLVTPSAELHVITADTIIVSVSMEKILVDGLEVARTEPLIAADQQQIIPGLKTAMDKKAGINPAHQKVGIAFEKGMNKNVIRSVYLTLRLSGYRDVHPITDRDAGIQLVNEHD